jgi:hypothetical protein
MHLRKVAYVLTLLALCPSALAASDHLKLQPLPLTEVAPITGEACGCIAFPQGAPLTVESIVKSSASYDGPHLVRIAGATRSLKRLGPPKGRNPFVNRFASGSLRLTSRTREVKYQDHCASYSDPPPHGSCFLGTLTIKEGQSSSSQKILELCGC